MLRILALAGALLCACTPALAFDDTTGNIWGPQPQFARAGAVSSGIDRPTPLDARGHVQEMIARHVAATIGAQWVDVALRIARIESGYRCNARNRRAVGVFQNTDPMRFGVSRSAALTCEGGVRAGVAHMAMCVRLGASSAASMMRCHNSGTPHGRVDRVYRAALTGR